MGTWPCILPPEGGVGARDSVAVAISVGVRAEGEGGVGRIVTNSLGSLSISPWETAALVSTGCWVGETTGGGGFASGGEGKEIPG